MLIIEKGIVYEIPNDLVYKIANEKAIVQIGKLYSEALESHYEELIMTGDCVSETEVTFRINHERRNGHQSNDAALGLIIAMYDRLREICNDDFSKFATDIRPDDAANHVHGHIGAGYDADHNEIIDCACCTEKADTFIKWIDQVKMLLRGREVTEENLDDFITEVMDLINEGPLDDRGMKQTIAIPTTAGTILIGGEVELMQMSDKAFSSFPPPTHNGSSSLN